MDLVSGLVLRYVRVNTRIRPVVGLLVDKVIKRLLRLSLDGLRSANVDRSCRLTRA